MDGLLAILSSISSRCLKEKKNYLSVNNNIDSDSEYDNFDWFGKKIKPQDEDLRKKKTLKGNMKKFCEKFNANPHGQEWLNFCEVYIYTSNL